MAEEQLKSNPFRNAAGQRYLLALFFEQVNSDKSSCVYTLKDHDHLGFPSLYRLYMEAEDPLEWHFAVKHLDGYEHWQMLCECTWFKPYIERWRKELELKLRGAALARIMADSISASRTATMSNRLLLAGEWKTEKNTKGRPTKAQIKAEARKQAEAQASLQDDLARITPSLAIVN